MGNVTKIDMNKQFEQIVSPVVVSVLHFLKIHRKMIFGNSPVVVQDMFGKTPKSFNTVDVIFRSLVNHLLRVLHGVMLAQPFQGVVAPEFVRVVYRPFPGFLSDDVHQFVGRDTFHNPRVDPAIALQKAEYDTFTLGSPSTLPLTSAAKVALVHFNLAGEFTAFQFCRVIDGFTQALVHSRDCLIVYAQIMRELVGGLRLVETLQDTNLSAKLRERLLFSTGLVSTTHIPATSTIDLERTAENALSASQKVGRTAKNVLLTSNHKGILTPRGYESH